VEGKGMIGITRDIIEAAARGDMAAFEVVYRACSDFVYYVALKVTRNDQDADDVTQGVFVTLFDKLSQFRFESSFETWIYRITVNHAINYAKKRSRERKRTVVLDDTRQVDVPLPAVQPEESREDSIGLVNQLLDQLDPDYRVYIVLREIEGLSYEEIAVSLKVNINTVRTRIRRAREKLLAGKIKGGI
jgi:RNA polymerase sigma-70 factor (ECF subfamily)